MEQSLAHVKVVGVLVNTTVFRFQNAIDYEMTTNPSFSGTV